MISKDWEWIKSVYFSRLTVCYRALESGYIRGLPRVKLLGAFKKNLQSISPCHDSRDNECSKCSYTELCCYYHLVKKDKDSVEYRPYLVVADDKDWNYTIVEGKSYSYEVLLIGDGIDWVNNIEKGLRLKKIISLDGHERKINFGFESFIINDPMVNILPLYEKKIQNNNPIKKSVKNITLEFVTNFKHQYKSEYIRNTKDMSFEILMDALHKRISGLAEYHCGFNGQTPTLESFMSSIPLVETKYDEDKFKTVRGSIKKKKGIENISGLKGLITFSGDITEYLPIILLGEELHLGRDTTMGLGRYRIIDIS